jgi:hypothetical protein
VDSGSQAPAVVFGGADSGADEPAPHRRRPWLIAVPSVIAVVAVIALGVVLLRPDSHPDSGASALADPLPAALPSAAPSATPSSAAAVSPTPSGAVSSAAAVAPKVTHSPIVTPTTPPRKTAAAITKITSPANGSDVAWATDVRYTMSAADLAASGTVVTVSICVSGRCYLDGAIQITGGKPVPEPIHLGSTAPEGVGLGWTLRLDRLSKSVYSSLTAQREAEIADSTWGDKGTSMDRLNSTPVSAVTVTKTG